MSNIKLRKQFEHPALRELPPTEMDVEISLYEAKQGAKRVLSIKDPALCSECVSVKSDSRRKCVSCAGQGYIHVYRQLEVVLPAGVLVGEEICYPELGRYNLCAQKNSDLIVKIKIGPHPYLELAGKNIVCTLVVPFLEAVLGKRISVPTAAGKAMIRLYPLTTSGKIYRLKGHGLSGGDQLINIEVLPWRKSSKPKPSGQFCLNCRVASGC